MPESLLRQARRLESDLSQVCEPGLTAEVAEARARRWLEANQQAMDEWKAHEEQHDAPLATFPPF